MGDPYRSALLNPLPEERNDGAVASQHVAESYGDKLCFDIAEYLAGAVLIRVLNARMGEELRNLVGLACFDLGVKALNDHLTQSLAGSHDVGGIDSFIC